MDKFHLYIPLTGEVADDQWSTPLIEVWADSNDLYPSDDYSMLPRRVEPEMVSVSLLTLIGMANLGMDLSYN